jgi:hypothetical protein
MTTQFENLQGHDRGQTVVFTCKVMTTQKQDLQGHDHARKNLQGHDHAEGGG